MVIQEKSIVYAFSSLSFDWEKWKVRNVITSKGSTDRKNRTLIKLEISMKHVRHESLVSGPSNDWMAWSLFVSVPSSTLPSRSILTDASLTPSATIPCPHTYTNTPFAKRFVALIPSYPASWRFKLWSNSTHASLFCPRKSRALLTFECTGQLESLM